ncbi:MAG: hypothetical protein E6Y42_12665, partial [Enterococcus gallinarum]|nr:hypothetical protein [Enterococcus gallinarum]
VNKIRQNNRKRAHNGQKVRLASCDGYHDDELTGYFLVAYDRHNLPRSNPLPHLIDNRSHENHGSGTLVKM